MVTNLGLSVLSIATGSKEAGDLGGKLTSVMFTLPNSTHETEADRMGVGWPRAGYDPRAAVTLWQKMGAADGGQAPPEFPVHPPVGRLAHQRSAGGVGAGPAAVRAGQRQGRAAR